MNHELMLRRMFTEAVDAKVQNLEEKTLKGFLSVLVRLDDEAVRQELTANNVWHIIADLAARTIAEEMFRREMVIENAS